MILFGVGLFVVFIVLSCLCCGFLVVVWFVEFCFCLLLVLFDSVISLVAGLYVGWVGLLDG